MAFGGAPYYWTLLERDKSVEQNSDGRICMGEEGRRQ